MKDSRGIGQDLWYFGDYLGGFSGANYNYIVYLAIALLLFAIALSTEVGLQPIVYNLYIPYTYELIEVFFIADYIGKVANTWSLYGYKPIYLLTSILKIRAVIDLSTLLLLITDFLPNSSLPVISLYLTKVLILFYFSDLRDIILRVRFIVFSQPAKTFFPLTLLAIVTYSLAVVMYLVEGKVDPEHFGSILKSLWFSFVSATTIGYGDVTPGSFLGRILTSTFALFGIVCIAILTANIIDLNARYDEQSSGQ